MGLSHALNRVISVTSCILRPGDEVQRTILLVELKYFSPSMTINLLRDSSNIDVHDEKNVDICG